jgi:hypothetical protein
MKEQRAYQLLVTEKLHTLFESVNSYPILIAILSWLIDSITRQHSEALQGTELEIVKAQFLGDGYPSLAIYYFDPEMTPDVAPLVEESVDRLLGEKTICDLIAYLATTKVDWARAAEAIMKGADTDA